MSPARFLRGQVISSEVQPLTFVPGLLRLHSNICLPMIGQSLSHYRIEAELGRGGMGVVFRAHDELLRRNVAVKLLHEDVVSEVAHRERILSEARAASALNHPGITTIYEVGEARGRFFIVMELVEGETLRQ